jgi:hypothetical protein
LIDPADPAIREVVRALLQLREFGFSVDGEEIIQRAITVGRGRHYARVEREQTEADEVYEETKVRIDRPRQNFVYYAQFRDLVKIGFTSDVRRRMQSLGTERLLTVELGGYQLEHRRHEEFADLRMHGEWFRYEGPLVRHVVELQKTYPRDGD